MKKQLKLWQQNTNDPLLQSENLDKLKAEVDSCFVSGEYEKKESWFYPEYFFQKL
jgi:hypothetical protein